MGLDRNRNLAPRTQNPPRRGIWEDDLTWVPGFTLRPSRLCGESPPAFLGNLLPPFGTSSHPSHRASSMWTSVLGLVCLPVSREDNMDEEDEDRQAVVDATPFRPVFFEGPSE